MKPTSDRYDSLVVQGTRGDNAGLSTGEIIAWLRGRELVNPFSILWAEHDTIEGYFLEPVDNLEELAAAMYEVCSDIVDQRSGGMEALIKSLRETRKMRFWWD